ncbi:DEAD/DEAH box helicase [Weissella coleopterorum]|uniref:DEAD/DEAH box helicase n=1 Tax=Weissella coleopterorum TaxID=2714949 RepID=A0A6G8AZW1_9LACO|nr:DEAD/DEAH box helicase [Weissella coleopterorum]QIL50413.1 DEAD/DEAH box helicase [Weissella coleopterorum]
MNEQIKARLSQAGFLAMTPIQSAVEPDLAAGESIDGLAPTGTGKTLAFTWPLLPKLQAGDGEQLLVMAPSQELAMQTTRVMREWASLFDLKVLALTGGANVKHQLDRLKKHPEILVGTPGRVAELVQNKKLKLQRLRTLILDEADILLKEETAEQLQTIWEVYGDETIQVALFGATAVDPMIPVKLFDRPFKRIDQRDVPMPTSLQHLMIPTANDQKQKRLRQFASQNHFQAMVFFNTTKALKTTASFLAHEHVAMATLVRGDSSSTRAKALDNFRKGQAKFLLTTDVAARGLDITDLSAVINFDLPRDGETYTHRAGRTGRMGKAGLVITLGNDHDARDLKRLVQVEMDILPWTSFVSRLGVKAGSAKLEGAASPTNVHRKPRETTKNSASPSKKQKPIDRKKIGKPAPKKNITLVAPESEVETTSRSERFEKIKKAKRRKQKDKGKPKRNQDK